MSNEKRLQRKNRELKKAVETQDAKIAMLERNMASMVVQANEVAKHHQQMVLVLASLALREDDRTIRVTHEEFGRVDQRAKMQTPHEEGVLVFRYDDSEVVEESIKAVEARDFAAPEVAVSAVEAPGA